MRVFLYIRMTSSRNRAQSDVKVVGSRLQARTSRSDPTSGVSIKIIKIRLSNFKSSDHTPNAIDLSTLTPVGLKTSPRPKLYGAEPCQSQ